MISKSESPSSRFFMRMSLSSKSGRWRATSTSASSPLFANVASKPSRVKTSHSNSHVTASSSTVRIWGILCDIETHLVELRNRKQRRGRRQHQPKLRAPLDVRHTLDLAAVLDDDLARNRQAQTATGLLRGPHRLEQMVLRVRRNADTRVAEPHLDQTFSGEIVRHEFHLAALRHRVETVVYQIQKHLVQCFAIRAHRWELRIELTGNANVSRLEQWSNQQQHFFHDLIDVRELQFDWAAMSTFEQ